MSDALIALDTIYSFNYLLTQHILLGQSYMPGTMKRIGQGVYL